MAKMHRVGLFGTVNRTNTLLTIHMLEESHASGIARILGISLSLTQKAIESLERAGVVIGVEEGRTRRIRLNPRYLLIIELKALLEKMALQDTAMQMKLAEDRSPEAIRKANLKIDSTTTLEELAYIVCTAMDRSGATQSFRVEERPLSTRLMPTNLGIWTLYSL
jgi:DNA-binding transcriptional ArsR family regulator